MTWWRAVRAVAAKDFQDLAREKTLLVAVAVQLFIAAFSAFLLFGLQGLNDPAGVEANISVPIYVEGSDDLNHMIRWTNGLYVTADRDDADVWINETITDGVHHVDVTFLRDDLTTSLAVAQVQVILQDYEEHLRSERKEALDTHLVDLDQVGAPAFAFAYATLLPLLVIVPVFLSGSVAGDAFAQEIQNKTLMALRAAPVPASAIVAGKTLLAVLLAPIQAGLWIGLLALNGFPAQHPGVLLLAITAMAGILCGQSVIVAVLLRREGATQAGYALLVLVLIGLSSLLPMDPLNLLARIAAGPLDAQIFMTLGVLGGLAAVMLMVASGVAAWALKHGKV